MAIEVARYAIVPEDTLPDMVLGHVVSSCDDCGVAEEEEGA